MAPNNKSQIIFIVANTLFTVVNFRKELISRLQGKGYQVAVLCPSQCSFSKNKNSVADQLSDMGVLHFPITLARQGISPLGDMSLMRQIYVYCKRHRPRAVLSYTIKPVIYASLAARFARVPMIASNITGLGYVFTDKSVRATLVRCVVRVLYRLALRTNTVVFFQNPDDSATFTSNCLVNENKVVVLNGSGVNLNDYQPVVRQQVDSFQVFKVLFVGRLLKDKGVKELIDAAYALQGSGVQITLVGGLDDNPNSIDIADVNRAMEDGVINYLGTVTNVLTILRDTDVFVLPSYREGTPRSSLEAMACGLPIITTNVPGCRETVVDGVNGYLIEPYSAEAITAAIVKMQSERGNLVSMGQQSRKIVETKFNVDDVNRRIIDACDL